MSFRFLSLGKFHNSQLLGALLSIYTVSTMSDADINRNSENFVN